MPTISMEKGYSIVLRSPRDELGSIKEIRATTPRIYAEENTTSLSLHLQHVDGISKFHNM